MAVADEAWSRAARQVWPELRPVKIHINVGIWGNARTKSFESFKALNREVEDEIVRQNGRKTLYEHSYYPKEKFWQIYDKKHYDAIRRKYAATVLFEDMYDKVTVTEPYNAPIVRVMAAGILRRVKSRLFGAKV